MTTRQAIGIATATLGFAAGIAVTTAPDAAATETYCGTSSRGVAVYSGNANTSCDFAMSTAEAYHSRGNGSRPFTVYSPVTHEAYTMTCTVAGSVCQGGNNAVVYLGD